MTVKSPAYRFRDGSLLISDEIEWPSCNHQLGQRVNGNFCERDAETGYINPFSTDLVFACRQHTFPTRGLDYWPLIPESEIH